MTLTVEGRDRETLLKHYHDQEMGFGRWHGRCQSLFQSDRDSQADLSGSAGSELLSKGYEIISALSSQQCQETIEACRTVEHEQNIVAETDYQYQLGIEDERLESIYRSLFSIEMTRKITDFFNAHFFIWSVGITQTVPFSGDAIGPSFHWHRDFGPSAHLKLLVYLNGFDEHGGATQLICIEDTQRIRQSGYAFPALDERQTDISHFAQQADVDYPPVIPHLHAGEAVLFRPFDVLHKAIFPTKSPRYIISMIILPSKRSWVEALRSWPISLQHACHGKPFDLPNILQRMI